MYFCQKRFFAFGIFFLCTSKHQSLWMKIRKLQLTVMEKIEIVINHPKGPHHQEKQTEQVRINDNGFTYPLTIWQTIPIIYVTLMILESIFIIINLQRIAAVVVVSILGSILIISTAALWVVTTKINPTDTIQILHKKSIQSGNSFNMNEFSYFCNICQTCVSNSAFHCRQCNRCVEVFDHHCKWLNNCIGAKNYFEFIGLISCSELLVIFHLVINISHLVSINESNLIQEFKALYNIEIIFSILGVIVFCFNTSLLGMHVYLIFNKKTTIQLIKERRIGQKIHPAITKNTKQRNSVQLESEDENSAADFNNNDKKTDSVPYFYTKKIEFTGESQVREQEKSEKSEKQASKKKTLKILKKKIRLQPLK